MSRPLHLAALAIAFALGLFSRHEAHAVKLEWAKNANAISKYSSNTVATAADKHGYVYYAGYFSGTLYFAGDSIFPAIGNQDGFVLKLNPAGDVIWARQFGHAGSNNNNCWDVTTDDSGNVYLSGAFLGTTDLDPGSGAKVVTAVGNWDGYACKLDSSGNFVWAHVMGGVKLDRAEYIKADKAGNAYISGYFQEKIDLNPGTGVDTFQQLGGTTYDHFLCKIDPSGNYLWGVQYQKGGGFDKIGGLALDQSGNAYTTGSFFSSMEFPASSGIATLYAVQPYDMFLVKVNSDGKFVWAKSFGGTGSGDYAYDIVSDENDFLYLVGNFTGSANLDPSKTTNQTFTPTPNPKSATGYYDVFVLKIDTAGRHIWATTFGSPEHDNGLSIAVDRAGNVYAGGSVKDTIRFVAGSTNPSDRVVPNGNGQLNPFIVKFDSSGAYQWSTTFGNDKGNNGSGIGTQRVDDMAIDIFGNLYVAGIFNGVVDFDRPNKVELDADKGSCYFLKFGCNDTSSSRLVVTECGERYELNGEVYSASGLYTQHLVNASGCDSSIFLDLTLTQLEPVINVNGFKLGVAGSYATYQWIKDGIEILGATDSVYVVVENGSYQVRVTDDAECQGTSEAYLVENVDIQKVELANQVRIYPNPTNGMLYISSPINVAVKLIAIDGKGIIPVSHDKTVNLSGLAEGIYFLQIISPDGMLIKTEKIIKHNQ